MNQILYNKDLDTKESDRWNFRSLKMLVIGLNSEHNIFQYKELERILEPTVMRFCNILGYDFPNLGRELYH